MKVLEGYENSFRTAIENNYCRNFGSRTYKSLNDIYERINGKRYAVNWGCPHCAIRFVQALGKLYFAEKERLSKVQCEPEPESVTTSAPKKKGGRTKKSATNNEQKQE